ncbi:MAG: YidC/Oxa1 family insertase periplasmic-domain containing protein [Phycisphaerales bacterium]|nr:YidC/Oxa1 family insertase periplasmic-domain containing protein [Phycisphaerales bacterium]
MTPETRRRIVTSVVLLIASIVLVIGFLRPQDVEDQNTEEKVANATSAPAEATPAATTPAEKPVEVSSAAAEPEPAKPATEEAAAPPPAEPGVIWKARPSGASIEGIPTDLGSLDPETDRYRVRFSADGAGIDSIVFSDFWTEARQKRAAAAHRRDPSATPLPPEDDRYALRQSALGSNAIPLLSAAGLNINGEFVSLFGGVWSEIDPGTFATEVFEEGSDTPAFRVTRRFVLAKNSYDIALQQRIENLTATPADVQWVQYGPGDLDRDRGSFIEVRRFHFGYLMPIDRDPTQSNVVANGQLYERQAILGIVEEREEAVRAGLDGNSGEFDIWPNETSREQNLTLSWFGATNRYFTLCVHAPFDEATGRTSRSITESVQTVFPNADLTAPADRQVLVTELYGPFKTIAAGGTADWDLGVYAGPLERSVLETGEPYTSLNMRALIVYLMSGCCTFCTFTWLADFLVVFLAFIHGIAFDWALAIVILVCIVRTLLHPVMKKGQVQMQRVSRLMSELKPEIDALQKKYKGDPAKMQAEQRRLFMERGVNPLGCVGGLLPTFLQMPIWIALYAVLFFAFELRQQEAFFGVFQLLPDVVIGNATVFGQFLGDLSRPDHFIEFKNPVSIYITQLTGVNILPLMMGFIFFVQQKYMSPPPSPNMTDEQKQQQKIMKVMMVVLFPVMLFQAPSGLTLYILTSSSIGIIEGRRIRKLVDKMDFSAKPIPEKAKKAGSGKTKDRMAKMYAEKLAEAKAKRDRKAKGPKKNYKKRDS